VEKLLFFAVPITLIFPTFSLVVLMFFLCHRVKNVFVEMKVEEENMPIKENFAGENRMFFLFLNRRQKRNSRKEKKVIKVFRN
jgi:hypothetical protein